MPTGAPKSGFRMTAKRRTLLAQGVSIAALRTGVVEVAAPIKPVVVETEQQIRERIAERFEVLTEMTQAVADGHARSMIVSGPAGLGKSYEIETGLNQRIGSDKLTIVKGHVSPLGLYAMLYENKSKGQVLVFDDADSIFDNELSLNMLKGACDTTEKRVLSWNSGAAEDNDLPRQFQYDGTIVYITNLDFDASIERGTRLAPHFSAMISRSHYLDLTLKNRNDYLTRIKMVVESGMLKDMGMKKSAEIEIMDFIQSNLETLREVSLRAVVKLANLYKSSPTKWQRTARITLCKN